MQYTGREKMYKSSGKSGRMVAMFNMSHAAHDHTILRLTLRCNLVVRASAT